jgi:hypothetical protein
MEDAQKQCTQVIIDRLKMSGGTSYFSTQSCASGTVATTKLSFWCHDAKPLTVTFLYRCSPSPISQCDRHAVIAHARECWCPGDDAVLHTRGNRRNS